MSIEICNAFLRLVNARNVAHRNPPQRDVHTGEILEPLLSLAKQFYVRCVIDEMSEVLDSFPYRHIHEDLIVVIRSKVCSVSFGGLKPPHEARIAVSERIDFIQPGHESRHHECDESKLIDVEANQGGPNIIVTDCHERFAQWTLDHAVHEEEAKRNGRENEEVLEIRVAEASLYAANGESRRQGEIDAVVATG